MLQPVHRLCPLPLIVSGLSLLAPLSATAQAAEEMLVQAGRLAQRQFDAPASVSAIDGEAIRNAGPQVNLSEALAQVPGVVALNRNNYAQDVQISIRGFGARAAFGLRGIRLIADGIPATTPDGQGQASTVALTSADRIEVLTGPLAQLYGNSAGGVIQTFTREAGDKPEVDVSTTYGSYGLRRHDVQLSGRTGSVGMVADYSVFSTDGYRAHSAAERKQLNAVLTADLSQDTRLKLIANAFDMPLALDPLGLTQADWHSNPKQVVTRALDNNTRKSVQQNQIGAVLEHRIDADLQLQMRAYTGTRENLQYQAGRSAQPADKGSWVGLDREFSGLGLQLQGRQRPQAGGQVQWVVGLDADQSAEQRQGGDTIAGEKSGGLTRNELNRSSNRDVYAQFNWRLDPGVAPLTLTGGLRRSQVELSNRDDLQINSQTDSVTYHATSPVLGLTWHATDHLNVYANWGKGFETPTLAETAYSVTTDVPPAIIAKFNSKLLASHSQHQEVGLKWTPSSATRLQAALFHIHTDNELVTRLSSSGKTVYQNYGDYATTTTRQGAELSWTQRWSNQWRSQLSAAWLQATYDTAFNSVTAKNRLPGIPERQLFATLQWAQQGFATQRRFGPLGLSANADWMARSALWASDMNDASAYPSKAAGYGVLNLRLRHASQWGSARVEAWVGVDNVTNRNYVSSVIVNQISGQYFEPGLPRQWMLGIRASIPL